MRAGWRKGRWGRGGEQKCAFSMEGTGSSIGLRAASSKEFGKGGRGLLVRVHFFFFFFPLHNAVPVQEAQNQGDSLRRLPGAT